MGGIEFLAITMKKRCIAEYWRNLKEKMIYRERERRMKEE